MFYGNNSNMPGPGEYNITRNFQLLGFAIDK